MQSPFEKDTLLESGKHFVPIPAFAVWNNPAVVANIPWTTLNMAPWIPAWSRGVGVNLQITAMVIGLGPYSRLLCRQSAAWPLMMTACKETLGTAILGVGMTQDTIMPLTNNQTFDYSVICGAGWTIWARIHLFGYC